MSSIPDLNHGIAKDVKRFTHCCFVRCVTLMQRFQTCANQCNVEIGLQTKVVQSKGWLVAMLGSRSFGPAKQFGPKLLSSPPIFLMFENVIFSPCGGGGSTLAGSHPYGIL